MAEYFFSRHNPEGFSSNDANIVNGYVSEYCNSTSSNYDASKCAEGQTYLDKVDVLTTTNAQSNDVSDEFSYEKMKTWNISLGIALLMGYLYVKNY